MPISTVSPFTSPDEIRSIFSHRLSEFYRTEVPLYSNLLELVSSVNVTTLEACPELKEQLLATNELDRLSLERHGAFRLGTAEELRLMTRFLGIMGMKPTGYYDLAQAGLPIHATCFRAHSTESLAKNPFRLFVSLLRLELVTDPRIRKIVASVLSQRSLFLPRMCELVQVAESNGGLSATEAHELVEAGLETFKWHSTALVSKDTYEELQRVSPLVADICGFRSAHINHITPRTLDIDLLQSLMEPNGIPGKEAIEGPPKRDCPILLRQTSFKAQVEQVSFPDDPESPLSRVQSGHHTARFGEIEQRGAALTPKGRALYDSLLAKATKDGVTSKDVAAYKKMFSEFPDSWETLRKEKLAWFQYRVVPQAQSSDSHVRLSIDKHFDELIQEGVIAYEPIVYEDFLPISAAGIFQSNLGNTVSRPGPDTNPDSGDKESLEDALGVSIVDEMDMYAEAERLSIAECAKALELLAR